MKNFNLLRKSERKSVGTTLALTVGSPSFDRRGTMLKHLAFMLLFLLGSLNVWGETEYELVYTLDCASASTNGTQQKYGVNNTTVMQGSGVKAFLNEAAGSTLISADATVTGSVYWAKGSGGGDIPNAVLKLGKSSGGGTISFTIGGADDITKVEVIGYGWKTTTAVSVNASDAQKPSEAQSEKTFSYEISATKTIEIAVTSSAFCATKIKLYKTKAGGSPEPTGSMTPNPISVDVTAEGDDGSISITYDGITDKTNVEVVKIYDDAEHTIEVTNTIDWLAADWNDDKTAVKYVVAANTGAERTAYIYLYALDDEANSVEVVIPVTQAKYSAPTGTFELFSGDIEEGDYVIYYSGKAMNTTVTSNRIQYAEVTPSEDKIVNPDKTIIWHIAPISETTYWSLYNESAEKYAGGTNTKNQGAMLASITDLAKWSISGSSTYEFVNYGRSQATSDKSNKYLRNNGTNGFACYTNSTGGALTLYKKHVDVAVEKPTISGETSFLTSTTVTLDCLTDGATIYYTTDESDPTTSSTLYSEPFELNATATIKAIAVKGEDVSAVAEMRFTKVTILTVTQAKNAIDAGGDLSNKYVAGIVSKIDTYNSSYNSLTYWISDDGTTANQLQVYSGLAGVVKTAFESTDDIHVGDDVTVKGTLMKFSSTYEFDKNNVIVAYKPIALLSWSAESYDAELGGSNSFPTLTNTNSVSVTYSSSNKDAATINATTGEISLVAEGSTTIKATFAGNENYKANAVSYTLKVKNAITRADISFEENGGSAVVDLTQQTNLPNPLPVITKAGKNFGGWFTDSELETPAVAGAAVTSTAAITLYAKWLDPYTVAEAKVIIDANPTGTENQYVAGIISQIDSYNTTYHSITYWISADGTTTNQLQVYSGLIGNAATALEKEQFTAKTDLELGDAVVVTGTLKLHNKTYEFDKNNSIYTFSRKVSAGLAYEITAIQKTVGDDLFTNPLTNPNSVTVTYSSSDENIALVDENTGEVLVGEEGTATITAAFAGNATYKAAEVSYIVTVSAAADTRKVANSPAKFTTTNGDLDPTDIAFEAFKGGASTAPANYNDGIRLYQASSEDAIGGFITLKAKKGCTIDQVKITTTDTYATTVAYSVDGNEHLLGSGSVAKSGDYSTPSGLNVESVNIVNKGSDKNSRLEIASIKVWYTGDALAVDHYFLGGTYETTFEQNGTFNYTGLEVYAAYDAGETITEPVEGFTVEADLSTAGEKKAEVYLNEVKIAEYNITVTAGKEDPALAYSPVSETITAGDAWSAPTLSNIFHVTPITYSSDKESVATVTSEGVITLAGGYGTAVITAHFDESEAYIESEATYTITVNKPAATPTSTVYRKITKTADITDGEYLIVYEGDETHEAAVFDGSLDNVDQAKKALPVEIVNNEIAGNTDLDAAVFTITVTAGTLQSASGWYIGRETYDNGMEKSTTKAYVNTFAITDDVAVITGVGNCTLRYNATSGQERFRYYKSGQQDVQLYKKENAEPAYETVRSGLEVNRYYTVCLPKKVTAIKGASFWTLNSKSQDGTKAYLEEETNNLPFDAGKPFIIQATATQLEVVYEGAATEEADINGALHGTLVYMNAAALAAAGSDVYMLFNNELRPVGENNHLDANRAYVRLSELDPVAEAPQSAPGRRVRAMPMQPQVATGFEAAEANEAPHKVLINGELFILRGEKMYDAKGQLVK